MYEDVVRMTGETPGAADAASQDAGGRAGVGGPVRVQVLRGKASMTAAHKPALALWPIPPGT